MVEDLTDLPNIGKTLAERLSAAGVNTPGDLLEIGSKEAFRRLKALDAGTCVNTLYALEGAVQGVRWHGLSEATKQELREFFQQECRL